MKRTGLSYREFVNVWKSRYVPFDCEGNNIDNGRFPECEPCRLNDLRISFGQREDVMFLFRKLSTFIRLWRRVQLCRGVKVTLMQLSDICRVLSLFLNDTVNS